MGRVFLCIQFLCYAHAEKTVTQIYCVLLNYFVERDNFFCCVKFLCCGMHCVVCSSSLYTSYCATSDTYFWTLTLLP